MKPRFCLECENFEDRGEIDGTVVCARNHRPGISCPDFIDRFENLRETKLRTRFCLECENFEDRGEIDGTVVCARNHRPGISCEDFKDRLVDIFYSYIYWAYMYKTGRTDLGVGSFEDRFSRKLSNQELAYACLLSYFELGLGDSHFYRCWSTVRKNYKDKLPAISKIFDAALERFNLHNEKTDLKRVFKDILSLKTGEETAKLILDGHYKRGGFVK